MRRFGTVEASLRRSVLDAQTNLEFNGAQPLPISLPGECFMSSKPPPPSSRGNSPAKVSAHRQIPKSESGRKPLFISKIIVALIVAGFVASLAGAPAPLLLGASKWWLVLSFLLLGVSTMAWMALREP